MRKLLACTVALFALTTASCSSADMAKFNTTVSLLTNAQVPGEDVIAAIYAFDLVREGARAYAVYCKSHLSQGICSAGNRRIVVRAGRNGTNARNRLEAAIDSGSTVGARALYDALIAATTGLETSPAKAFTPPPPDQVPSQVLPPARPLPPSLMQ